MARGRKRKVKSSGGRVGAEKVPLDAETRRVRLKNLIVMGKERGYLIYSEINDHLPEDVLDAEARGKNIFKREKIDVARDPTEAWVGSPKTVLARVFS